MCKNTSTICKYLGLGLCLVTLCLAFGNRNRSPVLLNTPEGAKERVTALMDALCAADYPKAEGLLYGGPELGLDGQTENPAAQVLGPLYQKSLSYTIQRDPYVTDTGLAVCVDVHSVDVSSLMETMRQRLGAEGQQIPMEHWAAALREIPQLEYPYNTHTVTLALVYDQGQWWILPEEALLKVVSGTAE